VKRAVLDLVKDLRKHERQVSNYIDTRVSTYFGSACYKALENRFNRLRSSLDMQYHKTNRNGSMVNDWKMKLAVPLVREAFLAQRASLVANFRNDPLMTVQPMGGTRQESARFAQDTLVSNFRSTKFRRRCLWSMFNSFARYGSCVSQAFWRQSVNTAMYTQPNIENGQLLGYTRAERSTLSAGSENRPVHILNYFQNPNIPNPEDSDHQGHIERWSIADLLAEAKEHPDLYIRDNVEKVIQEAHKSASGIINENYFNFNKSEIDNTGIGVDVVHYWGTLNIPGNEESRVCYYVEWIDGIIVRFQDNQNDGEVRPYSVGSMDKREEYWWGTTSSENQVPFENAANVFLNLNAEAGLRAMQSFIFYNRAYGITPHDLNQAAKNGAWVAVDLKQGQRLSEGVFPWQRPEVSMSSTQYSMSEIKESSQRVRPKADFTRNAVQGGPQNKTATAALAMDQQGDMQENVYFVAFEHYLQDLGETNLRILQTFLPDRFRVRPKPGQIDLLEKIHILGDFEFWIASTLTKNRQVQAMNLVNTLTALMNFRGSMDPSWMAVRLPPIIRAWLREIDLPVDIDEVMPDDDAMMGMGMMGMGAPGAGPGMGGPGPNLGAMGSAPQPANVPPQMMGVARAMA